MMRVLCYKPFFYLICLVINVFYAHSASAELVVIVHPSNTITEIKKSVVRGIYMGKINIFPSGDKAIPLELAEGNIRKDFLHDVLGKSEGELQSHWSRMIFTGKATPPKIIENENSMRKLIGLNPSLIGYIDSANVDSSIKVVKVID